MRRPKTTPSFVVVVAQQRSGTTALRRCLVDTGLFLDFQEIFHPDLRGSPGNFWDFIASSPSHERRLAFPDRANVTGLFADYLHLLRSLLDEAGRQFAMFDVKLNSSHSLNEIWHQPGARGNLFNLISQRTDIAVLHLERSNIFAQAISERIAEKTGVWHLEPGQARSESNRVTIAPGSILKRLIELDQGAELLRASVRGMRSCVTLQYEGLFADGSLAPVAREKIASVTGASLPDRCEVALTKVVGNLKHSIRNWESVVDFFDGTDYADLARHTFE